MDGRDTKRSEPQTGDTPVDAAVETTLVETAERKAGSAVGAITRTADLRRRVTIAAKDRPWQLVLMLMREEDLQIKKKQHTSVGSKRRPLRAKTQ